MDKHLAGLHDEELAALRHSLTVDETPVPLGVEMWWLAFGLMVDSERARRAGVPVDVGRHEAALQDAASLMTEEQLIISLGFTLAFGQTLPSGDYPMLGLFSDVQGVLRTELEGRRFSKN